MHFFRASLKLAARGFSSNVGVSKVERLASRSLLRLSGTDVSTFLQGLVTNDMRHLEEGADAMYCVFLNNKGRVIYDSIVYRPPNEDGTFLVECATDSLASFQKHLKLYRVRRKINIDDINNDFNIWVAYGDSLRDLKTKSNDNLIIVHDPRLKDLGYRIICDKSKDISKELDNVVVGNEYKDLRYRYGVGEGVEELPPGNCFPLEANCDYLHGVSFHKGCYIGQELTARTHHTGVVRKRLMPLTYQPTEVLPSLDTSVIGPGERPVGKLRGLSKSGVGLGLLRVAEVLKNPQDLKAGDLNVSTYRPEWWPAEVSKERPVPN